MLAINEKGKRNDSLIFRINKLTQTEMKRKAEITKFCDGGM